MKKSKYEIKVNNNWAEVSFSIFRSWAGERKRDGKNYLGKVYYYLGKEVFSK